MTTPTHPTLGHRLTGLAASVAVLGIILGLPALFLAIGASPIPDHVPTLDGIKNALLAPDDGTLVLGLFKVIGWVAWAFMALSLVVEAIARLRKVQARQLPGLGRPQAAARGLIGLAALLFIAAPIAAQSATITSAAAAPVTVGHVNAGAADQAPAHQDVKVETKQERQRKTVDHAVKPGESLWSIAEDHFGDGARYKELVELNRDILGAQPSFLEPGWVLKLPALNSGAPAHDYTVQPTDTLSEIAQEQLGDADRWPEIYQASTGITQPGGAQLTDPDVIDVGWKLNIPGADQGGSHDDTRHQQPRDVEPETPASPEDQRLVDPPAEEEPPVAQEPEAPDVPEAALPDVAPSQAEEPWVPAADVDQVDDADDSILDAPWVRAGLTGGGVLLSGALLMALRSRRRAGYRNRTPGRAIAAPPPELAPVEMTLNATGSAAAATVEFADEALRRLAAAVGAQGTTMPPLAAVELGHGKLTLHLSAPAAVPAPWVGSPDQTHWHVSTDTAVDELGPDTGNVEPPYPLLATIGMSDTGETWLLNCEELSTLTISGDPTYGRDFARHLAAQLAVNPWSRRVQVDCIGVAEEAVAMDERISYYPTGAAGSPATAEALAAAVTTVDRAKRHDTDASTARTGSVDDDTWPARMLLLDAAAGDPEDLEQLLQLVTNHVGQSATSIVVAGGRPNTPGAVLHMTNTGRVVLEHAGLNLIAVGLTSDEARGCALVYAQSEVAEDVPVPVDETVTDGWEAYTDQSGALRREYTLPRNTPADTVDEPLSSLLEGDDEDYIRQSAIVQEDLETLAPKVPEHVRAEVEQSDPTLDQDIADWFSTDCDRPRLSLLGPVTARTHGKALAKRKPYFTELLAYLALHRKHGATREEIGEAFGITPGKVRDYTNTVREWLGTNPTSGEPHLPHADKAPATKLRGVNVYQVDDGLLVDLHLFLRLRKRGQARGGAEGVADVCTALELVGEAKPFSQLREEGWSWLVNEPDRVDLMASGWIADVALIVVTEALAAGDLVKARSAAYVANRADPDGESTRLCLAHVMKVESDQLEADRILREEICNRSDDGDAPMELSERTKTIISTHGWLAS
ncbi:MULTISPECIES: LysM peptidoglycan-binding domain-containing protein [unclassified Nocardioides]|uniref:LysM peptidoglycan-binding domain-containing protein n=1 Tax=unclassified Nocardioides TaxID=2615069 RepID=UPI0009F0918A|nr:MULTISPECIES: LysM peptidoglycan-binding domain-containing protein [unclassified Nocardioides]GAW49700.1 peptidoglycan-binding LysM [Nocardioides sp. PD653-B2]GAW56560.1 peptidoglycan-binding LysM [Nocardioides sp. PD653]